ncbi:MAG: cardiolipin synthase [Deferribacterales bacterium]
MTAYLDLFFQHLGEIVSLILVLVILSGRREARANFSWLMVVVLFPFVGAVMYILLGNPRLKRMLEKKFKSYQSIDLKKYVKHDEEFDKSGLGALVEKITGVAPHMCSNLRLIIGGGEKYSLLAEDIGSAEKYVLMEYYVFKNDFAGKFFTDLLIETAERGVKVYLLVDGFGSFLFTLSGTYRRLRKSRVKIAVFHPPFGLKTVSRVNFRNHRKIAIIDGRVCYTGGMNIGSEYVGGLFGNRKWFDAHLSFGGDAVYPVEEVFAEDWLFATGENIEELIKSAQVERGGDTTVQVVPSGPHMPRPLIYSTLFSTLNRARKSVVIVTPYLVPDQPVIETLKNISRQGIDVTIILPGKNNQPLAAAAGRSYYEELIENGVRIHETKDIMLHAKLVVIDDYFVIAGSANMDGRSFKINFELNIVAYSGAFAEDAGKLVSYYLSHSEEVELKAVRSRPFAVRVFEGVCRTLGPVL